MGVHDNHRERMRRRFIESGGADFEEYQLLELILYYSIPRSDTNPIAHELIAHFGSLKAVFDAKTDELCKIAGIGERSAVLIKLMQRAAVAYIEPDKKRAVIVRDSSIAGAYLVPKYLGEREEVVYLLCLDSKGKLLGCSEVGRGDVNSSGVDFRKVVEIALAKNAVSVIISHNHPSGVALPSRSDTLTTQNLKKALALVNITLSDHIIVSDQDWVSMADSAMM